jgi:hypothetical protein
MVHKRLLIGTVMLLANCVLSSAHAQDDVATATLKRLLAEAHCPPVQQGRAARATTCTSKVLHDFWAEHWPGSLDLLNASNEANLAAARKLDVGKLSLQQYIEETEAINNEFVARVRERNAMLVQQAVREQCDRILSVLAMGAAPALEAAALEKLRNLGCLR